MNAVGGGRPDDVFELHGAIAGQADAYDGAVPQGAAHHGASVGFSFKMPPVTDEAAAFALDGVRYFPIKAEGYQEQ